MRFFDAYIGLDPGTKTGFAVLDADGERLLSGVMDCAIRRGESDGIRFVRLSSFLVDLMRAHPNAIVGYEQVERHAATIAAQVYGGVKAEILRICDSPHPTKHEYLPCPVGTIKRHATGRGNVDKGAMIAAARARWDVVPADDNEADALWIADYTREVILNGAA